MAITKVQLVVIDAIIAQIINLVNQIAAVKGMTDEEAKLLSEQVDLGRTEEISKIKERLNQ